VLIVASPATTVFDQDRSALTEGHGHRLGTEITVNYVVADLLDPPAEWTGAFDFVVESITVQSGPNARLARAVNIGPFAARIAPATATSPSTPPTWRSFHQA
jgi:hypothetical protein